MGTGESKGNRRRVVIGLVLAVTLIGGLAVAVSAWSAADGVCDTFGHLAHEVLEELRRPAVQQRDVHERARRRPQQFRSRSLRPKEIPLRMRPL